jgi:hypothetical protein
MLFSQTLGEWQVCGGYYLHEDNNFYEWIEGTACLFSRLLLCLLRTLYCTSDTNVVNVGIVVKSFFTYSMYYTHCNTYLCLYGIFL